MSRSDCRRSGGLSLMILEDFDGTGRGEETASRVELSRTGEFCVWTSGEQKVMLTNNKKKPSESSI